MYLVLSLRITPLDLRHNVSYEVYYIMLGYVGKNRSLAVLTDRQTDRHIAITVPVHDAAHKQYHRNAGRMLNKHVKHL